MATPPIRFTQTRDAFDIAYWTLGRGPVLVHTSNVQLAHARAEWSVEGMQLWYEALARSFTVVRYDHRGGGLSSRGGGGQSIDALIQDIEAVGDVASPDPFVLLGWLSGAVPAMAYAARRPERVSHLIVWCGGAQEASQARAPRLRSLFDLAASDWELFTESIAQAALSWCDADEARRWAAVGRAATTQAEFLAFLEARSAWDVRADLAEIKVPTLVMHDASNALAKLEHDRELAELIPNAGFIVCESDRGTPGSRVVDEILAFVGADGAETSDDPLLTPREREVLGLVAQGATNGEIAQLLFISIHTVTRHLTHIYAKTGVANRAQAVRYALSKGLAKP